MGIAHAISLSSRIDLAKLTTVATSDFLVHILLAPAKIGAGMLAAEPRASRHHIAVAAMACLCVLLGGPFYAAGAESLFIAGATYREPGASGPGWAWTDAGHLELDDVGRALLRGIVEEVLVHEGQRLEVVMR